MNNNIIKMDFNNKIYNINKKLNERNGRNDKEIYINVIKDRYGR